MTSRDLPSATDAGSTAPPEGSRAPDVQGPVPTSHNPVPAEAIGDPEERRPGGRGQEGAAAGAIAGTAIAGPLGTIVGGAIGAVAGGAADAAQDDDERHITEEAPDHD